MVLNSQHIFWTGFGILMVFIMMVYFKYHRKKYVIGVMFIIGILSAIIGIFLIQNPNFVMVKGHGATTFFAPIIYVSSYQVSRLIYKNKLGIEPAYEFASYYDHKDKRGLNIGDFIVYILPMTLAIVAPLIIGWK